MDWDIDPYSTINAASMHHICEGEMAQRQSVHGWVY